MNNHKSKIIAPAIVASVIIVYYIIVTVVFMIFKVPGIIRLLAILTSGIVTAIMILVLIERIKEIKSGEEDDLSKY